MNFPKSSSDTFKFIKNVLYCLKCYKDVNAKVRDLWGEFVKKTVISHSEKETDRLGLLLGQAVGAGCVIAFYGDLGAGKTHFIAGLAKGLGYNGETYSPTFALVNEYLGGRLPLYHFDMYRITGWEDLYSTGFFDYMELGGVLAVEWSENIEAALPENVIRVTIRRLDDQSREITVDSTAENACFKEEAFFETIGN